jgi:hypothetical protein
MLARILAISVFLAVQGCSGKNSEDSVPAAGGEPQHVWKKQVETIDKARKLEEDMNDAFRSRAGEVDAQTR